MYGGGDLVRFRKYFRRRPRYSYSNGEKAPVKRRFKNGKSAAALIFLAGAMLFAATATMFLEELATEIAVSDASDVVTVRINNAIADIMKNGDYGGDYFVSIEKDSSGEVTAISSNMSRINALSAHILDSVVGVTENHTLTVEIPIGNLTGISVLMGRGPKIPVQIIVLTS